MAVQLANPATNPLANTADEIHFVMRGLMFAMVLVVHGVVLALALHIKTVGSGYDVPGVLQVSWVESEQHDLEPPATPEPEVAPKPLPMRPQLVVVQPRSRAKPSPKPSPILALAADTPGPEGLPEIESRNESTEPSPIETASTSLPEGPVASSGSQSGAVPSFTEPSFEADYLSNPRPEYPLLSRRLSEQGLVTLSIHVTVEGKADKVVLYQSSGFERLDKAAADVVWRWRFTPAHQNGKNVAAWVLVPIRFTLRS
jgi:protein TonB